MKSKRKNIFHNILIYFKYFILDIFLERIECLKLKCRFHGNHEGQVCLDI